LLNLPIRWQRQVVVYCGLPFVAILQFAL